MMYVSSACGGLNPAQGKNVNLVPNGPAIFNMPKENVIGSEGSMVILSYLVRCTISINAGSGKVL